MTRRSVQTILGALILVGCLGELIYMSCRSAADVNTNPGQTITGDSRLSLAQWNEFYHSDPNLLAPNTAYRISFSYNTLSCPNGSKFYILVRDSDHNDTVFIKTWDSTAAANGHFDLTYYNRTAYPYRLVFGIEYLGKVVISDLSVVDDPTLIPHSAPLPKIVRTWTSPAASTYYVDSANGNDANSGLTAGSAWASLDRINSGTFAPGDKILLHRGSSWDGFFSPGGSGTAAAPIVVTSYGDGPKPRMNAAGAVRATVYLTNCSNVTIRNVDISNRAPTPTPGLTGVLVRETNFGTATGLTLDSLNIHDVDGSDVKDDGGGSGISCQCSGNKIPTRFDGLTIENCRLNHTDRDGITMYGSWNRSAWYPSLHVIIRNNILENIGGDGIVPIACDGALVEHNILHGARMRAADYAAGIWPWSCDNTVVQFNEVSGMKGTNDGEGYDSDWNCRNSLFQYNYSHNNDGGFMLICDNGSVAPSSSAGNSGTIVRYNVSVDDGLHTFHISGPCSNTRIYNNTFYLAPGSANQIVAGDSWGGYADGTTFSNNIFDSIRDASFSFGKLTHIAFHNNLYWGNFDGKPQDLRELDTDPLLTNPSGGQPADFRPKSGSPCIAAGATIANNGGRDFAGSPVQAKGPPTIGAFQK